MSKRNTALVMCTILHGFNHCQQVFLTPLYPAMQADLGFLTVSPVLLLSGVFFFCYGVSGIPFGILADRFSKKAILGYGFLLSSLAFGLCGLTRDYRLLIACFALAGIGGGTYHPASNSFVTLLFPREKGRALGATGAGSSVGFVVAPLVGGYLGQVIGWQRVCMAMSLLGVIFSFVFLALVPELRQEEERMHREDARAPVAGKQGFGWGVLALLVLLYCLRELGNYGYCPLTSFFGQTVYHFSPSRMGLLLSLVFLPGILVQPLFGSFSDRASREVITVVSLSSAGIFILLTPWFPGALLGLSLFLFGAFFSAHVPVVDAIVAEKVPASSRSTAYGVLLALGIGAGSFSPVICGWILDRHGVSFRGFVSAYVTLCVFCLAAAAVALAVYLRTRRR